MIGIDLDNTLIDYRKSFSLTALKTGVLDEAEISAISRKEYLLPNKNEIKKYLLSLENGDFKWESLQGQVYGNYIHYAQIYPGAANFLIHCYRRGKKVYIISHKTEFGHYDKKKISLRKAALNFFEKNNLFSEAYGLTKDDIFFFDTRKEKANKIAELNCDYFIDDLPEVFAESNFPTKTKKILFDIDSEQVDKGSFNSWYKINDFFFKGIEEADIITYVENGTGKKVKSAKKINGRGNSSIFRIINKSGNIYSGKLYNDPTFDSENRLEKESKAFKFLHINKINYVPKVIWKDDNLNFGLYEWINGSEIKNISNDNIIDAITFVKTLADLSKKTDYGEFELASSACISGKNIMDQIYERYKKINIFSNLFPELKNYLNDELFIAIETILKFSKQNWPGYFYSNLSKQNQLLSPSDFGFHNTILNEGGVRFIDFEYFGWDDPVKLTSDFILHPGMDLTDEQKKLWVGNMKTIFSHDPSFTGRLNVSYFLYGLCWCLILLNEFCTDGIEKRNSASSQFYDVKQKQAEQLIKSKAMLNHLTEKLSIGLFFK
jgi:hypothetical protein